MQTPTEDPDPEWNFSLVDPWGTSDDEGDDGRMFIKPGYEESIDPNREVTYRQPSLDHLRSTSGTVIQREGSDALTTVSLPTTLQFEANDLNSSSESAGSGNRPESPHTRSPDIVEVGKFPLTRGRKRQLEAGEPGIDSDPPNSLATNSSAFDLQRNAEQDTQPSGRPGLNANGRMTRSRLRKGGDSALSEMTSVSKTGTMVGPSASSLGTDRDPTTSVTKGGKGKTVGMTTRAKEKAEKILRVERDGSEEASLSWLKIEGTLVEDLLDKANENFEAHGLTKQIKTIREQLVQMLMEIAVSHDVKSTRPVGSPDGAWKSKKYHLKIDLGVFISETLQSSSNDMASIKHIEKRLEKFKKRQDMIEGRIAWKKLRKFERSIGNISD